MANHDSVGLLYRAIEKDLHESLRFDDSSFLKIARTMTGGLSGAEVYLIHLHCPILEGDYFLKIEKKKKPQADPANIPFPHAKCAAFVHNEECNAYIFAPAGLSTTEFCSYREAKPNQKILQSIISKHLRTCQEKGKIMQPGMVAPDKIMRHMLGNKLLPERDLYRYLVGNFRDDPAIFTSISIFDTILPNPYAFAISAGPWKEYTIKDAACPCHGDMHGENLLLAASGSYCLIDHTLYMQDGWLFYDSAYFEIAELLQSCGTDTPEVWTCNMRQMAKGQFDSLEFNGLAMVQAIRNAESAWLDEVCSSSFSFKDTFLQAKLLARVIAGLNFAGKRGMKDDLRLKAFLYAAANLEAMLTIWHVLGWGDSPAQWEPGQEEQSRKVAADLAEDAGKFGRGAAFILFCGPQISYGESLAQCLARIPWHSVFSFNPDPDGNSLFGVLRDTSMLNSFYPGCETGGMSSPSWVFAAGKVDQPETVANNFGEWNRKCHRFVESMLDKCAEATAWNAPLVIIDADSLPPAYMGEIIRLCHSKGFLSLGILGRAWRLSTEIAEQWKPMEIVHYPMSITDLGAWCRMNLEPLATNPVIVPCASEPSGAVVSQKDLAAIEAHGRLIHNGLLRTSAEEDLYSFYYGHPISWEALNQGLYVTRDRRVDALAHGLEKSDGEVPIVEFPHFPGAGASMLCKAACWQLRHKYPVLELTSMEEELEEGLLRLSSLCGLSLLLLADNNFSPADIKSLASRLHKRNISARILYPRRVYSSREAVGMDKDARTNSDILSNLEVQEAEAFLNAYSKRLRQGGYSPEDIRKREESLDRLAHEKDLEDLRLPFFFGMFAYEKDFVSLEDFVGKVLERLKENAGAQKLVQYLALITQYLGASGLNIHVGAMLVGIGHVRRLSVSNILKLLHEICGAPIISCTRNRDSFVLRLVHPLLAEKILEKFRGKDAGSKAAFYKNFLHDLDSLGEGIPSNEFEDLAQALFLERDWDGRRLKFSPLIEDLDNYAAKKDVFETLIDIFNTNAHFHQHFGRLISHQEPVDTVLALEHFNKAVEIESTNMVHWHARGNFYLRRVAKEIIYSHGITDIYNKFAKLVELAMGDFSTALEKARATKEAGMDAEYPANSIIRLAALVLNSIRNTEGADIFRNRLTQPVTPEMKWAVQLMEKAEEYALEAESFGGTHSDYGVNARGELAHVRFGAEELENMIGNSHKDFALKLAWMNSVKPESTTPSRLQKMVDWGEELIQQGNARPGLVWQWFKAVLLLGRDSVPGLRARVQQAENSETALICAYLQACLNFAAFMSGSAAASDECLRKMVLARNLWSTNKYLFKPMLYYNPASCIGLALTPENAPDIACKVAEEVVKPQAGMLYLEKNVRFRVFFTPVHFDCDIGQSLGKTVSCRIAISYDGLRAVKPDQKSGNRDSTGHTPPAK